MEPQLSNKRSELTFTAVFVRYLIRLNFCSTRTDPASCAVSFQSKISRKITEEIRFDLEDFSMSKSLLKEMEAGTLQIRGVT